MPRDEIKDKYKPLIWGRAAGHCELCSRPVFEEGSRRQPANFGNLAHICAASEGGPRYDSEQSQDERTSIDNVMLLCQDCHKIIDSDPVGYPTEMLQKLKREREDAITVLMEGLRPEKYNMIQYLARFGETDISLSPLEWKRAMLSIPGSYEGFHPFDLNPRLLDSCDVRSIPAMAKDLELAYTNFKSVCYEKGPIAVFALASQPLLIKLGCLIGDETPFVCFEKCRGSAGWSYSADGFEDSFTINRHLPDMTSSDLILKISISGKVNDASIPADLLERVRSVYEFTVESPGVCKADSRDACDSFRVAVTDLLYAIHEDCPAVRRVHVFPAMPASFNVIFGSVLNTHVLPEFIIYEKRDSVFSESLTIGGACA